MSVPTTHVELVEPRHIAVIGTGYVGLTAAACLASFGHYVVCADISFNRINQLSIGVVPIYENGLPEMILAMIASGRLNFTISNIEAIQGADFVFMCLPTPEGADGNADLSAIEDVAKEIGPHLMPHSIVINKSTVPVGTAYRVHELLRRPDVNVVSNPEFLAEGSAVSNFLDPDRIVIGAESPEIGSRVAKLYGSAFEDRCIMTDIPSAELIKYASNAYLATRLTFINSIAEVCEAVGANISTVALGVGSDSRIGPAFLNAGPGWGGSCFPKDTQALIQIAKNAGCDLSLVRTVIEVNDRHTLRIVHKVADMVGGSLPGKRIAVWGLTFKAGTNDVRSSPAIKIVEALQAQGAIICAYDPAIELSIEGIELVASKEEACLGADVLLVAAEWPEFAQADLEAISTLMSQKCIVDARNVIDQHSASFAGFEYTGVGRGNSTNRVVEVAR